MDMCCLLIFSNPPHQKNNNRRQQTNKRLKKDKSIWLRLKICHPKGRWSTWRSTSYSSCWTYHSICRQETLTNDGVLFGFSLKFKKGTLKKKGPNFVGTSLWILRDFFGLDLLGIILMGLGGRGTAFLTFPCCEVVVQEHEEDIKVSRHLVRPSIDGVVLEGNDAFHLLKGNRKESHHFCTPLF